MAPADWERARETVCGRVLTLPSGRADLARTLNEGTGLLGLLVVDGLLCSDTALAGRHLMEYLGPGDVLQVPADEDQTPLVADPSITVIDGATLMTLGQGIIRAAERWPELLLALLGRLERQRRRLATQALIVHLPLARHRLLLILWHLATRWGYVTREGVHVDLRLTHDLLGRLIAARRPTVSLAIKELDGDGHLRRLDNGAWLVTEGGQDEIRRITAGKPALAPIDQLPRRDGSAGAGGA